MTRVLIIATATLALSGFVANGQSLTQTSTQTQTTSATDLTTASPQENASGGRVAARAPGTWVQAAITRHSELMAQRLQGPRFGQQNTQEGQARGGTQAATTGQSGFGGLADLLRLATQFGSTGSLSGLSGLLTGTTGTTTGSTGGFPPPANGTSYTLEDLIRLGQMHGGGTPTPTGTSTAGGSTATKTSTSQTNQQATPGGAIGRLPKPEQRVQQTTTSTPQVQTDFKTRWANAMLQTFFSAVTLGLQSNQVIGAIKDALRPLILPPAENNNGGNSGGSGNGSGNGSGGGSGNGSGGGIEDLNPGGGGGGSGGSTL